MHQPAPTSFDLRWRRYSPTMRPSLQRVYGERADDVLARLRDLVASALAARPESLKTLDEERLLNPDWLQRPEMLGYVAYTERFAGSLAGVADRLDYLDGLGVRYLHLMPFLQPRPGANDGGYAVADYRAIRPDLGTVDDLAALTARLREHGISLVMDLVLNHVAREHDWARRARAGEPRYRDYFLMFPDRTLPELYEQHLPEVFPDFAPGNFTFDDESGSWVWTTFNDYQWDLNWANPDVLCEFVELICWLANQGVEVFRLDAIAFIWKRMGTSCQNQPEVHDLTQVLRACLRVAAPAVAFKAEAIVAPHELLAYLGYREHYGLVSDMAYHNLFMVQLWNCLATRDVRMAEQALSAVPPKPASTTWATYARCHDDIGWAISDDDAAAVGADGYLHRAYLSEFYSGATGSFARGLVFQANPATGDRRISGTLASLAGLESALDAGDERLVEAAVARVALLHAAIAGFGGIPLLYMGDELGLLNDYDYANEPAHAMDNRWAHRPRMDWALVERLADDPAAPASRINAALRHIFATRARLPQLHASFPSEVVPSPDRRVLVLERRHPMGLLLQVYNFSSDVVPLDHAVFTDRFDRWAREVLGGHDYNFAPATIDILPYQAAWFVARPGQD